MQGIKLITLSIVGTTMTAEAPPQGIEGIPFMINGVLTKNNTGEGVPQAPVKLLINGVLYATDITDTGGGFGFDVTLTQPGNYTITLQYSGGACVSGCIDTCIDACIASCVSGCIYSCISGCVSGCIVSCTLDCTLSRILY